MAIRIVQLGTPRQVDEGVRLGTVRRPPRGVKKTEYASRDYYDVWLPNLAPSPSLVAAAKAIVNDRSWRAFARKYQAEMAQPNNQHLLRTLAALSHGTNFSIGCYCIDERRCHRGLLRVILKRHGAAIRS